MSESSCLQSNEYWHLALASYHTQKKLLGLCLLMQKLERKLHQTIKKYRKQSIW